MFHIFEDVWACSAQLVFGAWANLGLCVLLGMVYNWLCHINIWSRTILHQLIQKYQEPLNWLQL
jgi:hypothetical protein